VVRPFVIPLDSPFFGLHEPCPAAWRSAGKRIGCTSISWINQPPSWLFPKQRKIRRINQDRSAKKVAQPDAPVGSQNKGDNLWLEREATDGMTANIRGFLLNVKGIAPIRVVWPKPSTSFFVIQECEGHGRFNVILAVLPQWRRYRSSSWSSLPRRHAWPRHRQSRVHQLARAG
jgi:hypothetical protein